MKVTTFRRDPRRMHDGEWIPFGPGWEGIEVRTRAMLPSYRDAVQNRISREARRAGVAEDRIKSAARDKIIMDCLIEHCLQDIKGLENADGSPLSFDDFCDLIRLEEYAELAGMAITATGQVGRDREEQLKSAVGNSPAASAINSLEAAK